MKLSDPIKTIITFVVIALHLHSCSSLQQKNKLHDIDLIITHINIIDPVNRRINADQTILIKGDTIVKVFDSNDEKLNFPDSLIVNGKDKYVISGFWNMHAHICWKYDLIEKLFPLLLEYGITGIRDMGGDANILSEFKTQINQSPQMGPLIFGAGSIIDGEYPIHPDFSVALTKENIKQTLDSLYDMKVDFFKVYSLLPESALEEISIYSQQKGISFSGHISEYISPVKAVELGQKSFEHLNRIEELLEDTLAFNTFIAAVIKKKSWLCPTLIVYQRKVDLAQGKLMYNPIYKHIDNFLKSEWEYAKKKREGVNTDPIKLGHIESKYNEQKKLVKLLYDKKVPMLIGTDFAGMPYVYPGYSFHEEMALMSDIGFDNYDILRMATFDPTIYFKINDTYGMIEKGKIADLVILDKNPVENIRNTIQISTVIRAGKKIELSLTKPKLN